jgi:hypothetical protein
LGDASSSFGSLDCFPAALTPIRASGRYKPNATSLQNDFVVQGEQRYWVHVAIDRFTGQVIDKQIEVVNE